MWLPNRVYEVLPTAHIVVGLAILAGSLYINSYHKLAPMFFVVGGVSVLIGLFVSQYRLQERRRTQHAVDNRQVNS
jgi:uncharacterized membrane protein YgdD (TMEM256/DUF423 family)